VQPLLKGGSRLWIPEHEDSAKAIAGSIRETAPGIKPRKAGESKRRKIVDSFWIDYGRCMRCNICVEVCNFDAIAMNNTWSGHEQSVYDRGELVYDLDELLSKSRAEEIKPWVGALEETAGA